MPWQPPAGDTPIVKWTPPPGDTPIVQQPDPDLKYNIKVTPDERHESGWAALWQGALKKAKELPDAATNLWHEALAAGAKNDRRGALKEMRQSPFWSIQASPDFQTAMNVGLSAGPSNLAGRALSLARTTAQSRLRDMQAAGVTPNVPTVGQGYASRLTANAARALPYSPVQSGLERNIGETQAAAGRGAAAFGTPAENTEHIGNIVQNAIKRFQETKTQAGQDYGRFFTLMHGAPPAPLTKTLATLRKMMGRFENAPGLTGLFTKTPLKNLQAELQPKTVTIPAKTSPVLGPSGQPVITSPAQTLQRGGVLSIRELRELRTHIGYELDHPNYGPDQIPRAQLKQIYGALTDDMLEAARKRGPEAVAAIKGADFNFGTRMKIIDAMEPLMKHEASAESTFRSINTAAQGGNASILRDARKVMLPDEWGDVGATIVSKLGEPTAGAASSGPFSVASFSTNWAKLSGPAKDTLFGPNAVGSPRAGLETLARVAGYGKQVGRLANASHSGEQVNLWRVIEGAVAGASAALTTSGAGVGAGVATTLGSLGAAYGTAKVLMSPGFTRWIYGMPTTLRGMPSLPAATAAATESLKRSLMSAGTQPSQPLGGVNQGNRNNNDQERHQSRQHSTTSRSEPRESAASQ